MSNRRQRKSRSKVHIKEVTIELGNKRLSFLPENLHIILYVEYSDIQGKRSRDAIYIAINRIYFENDADGSGAAAYQLAPSLLIE